MIDLSFLTGIFPSLTLSNILASLVIIAMITALSFQILAFITGRNGPKPILVLIPPALGIGSVFLLKGSLIFNILAGCGNGSYGYLGYFTLGSYGVLTAFWSWNAFQSWRKRTPLTLIQ